MDLNTPGAVPRQRTFASQAMHAFSTRAAKSMHALVNHVARSLASSAKSMHCSLALSSPSLRFVRAKSIARAPFFLAAKPIKLKHSGAPEFDKLWAPFFSNFAAPSFRFEFCSSTPLYKPSKSYRIMDI